VVRAARALALLAACGGSTSRAPTAPKQQAVDGAKAEKDAKGLVTEIYATIGHGDVDGLMTLFVPSLVVFGPRRADALATRADALVALKQLLYATQKQKPSVRSSALAVVPSPSGRSAWAFDLVDVGARELAITTVLSNADDIWLVTAVSVAALEPAKAVRAAQKRDAVVPPGMAAAVKVEPSVRGAVDKFTRGLADQRAWGDELSRRSDAVVVGPARGELARGKQEIKKLWKKRARANVHEALAGEISAAATPDGELAWVTAPVVRFSDDDEPLPLRVFAVFEKRDGDYALVALHESLAVDAPGAGAQLKKTQPPAMAKKDEPKPDDDARPKKKKRKKPATDQ
jgi:ketosteroid isomerase-like protein